MFLKIIVYILNFIIHNNLHPKSSYNLIYFSTLFRVIFPLFFLNHRAKQVNAMNHYINKHIKI